MMLLFDLGNSRAKWATWTAGSYAQTGSVDPNGLEWEAQLRQQLHGIVTPDRILVASVASLQVLAAVQRMTHSRWDQEPILLQAHAMQCGVRSAYAEPAQMGVDRWLAMLAAWNRFQCPVCVSDIGTAVTVDVVAADGRHLGGLIAPGIALSQSVLQTRTAGVRHADPGAGAALGQSTGACVANGCLLSIVGTLRMALELMGRECGAGGVLVATGGDAPRILPFLPDSCVHVPNLIFDGMLLAARDQ
jgi:type III pantothenate kinase